MKPNRLSFVPLAILWALPVAPALAQQSNFPKVDCSLSNNRDEVFFGVTACARAELNRQILINNGEVLSRVVAWSFGMLSPPGGIEPAGLGDLTPDEARDRLQGGGSFLISPTADAPAAMPSRKWNSWIDGKYTWNDNSNENFDLDGPLTNILAGIDYKITPKFTLGVMATYESSNLNGPLVDTNSSGWGAGPYLGIQLTDNVVFSANVIGTSLNSDQTGGPSYDSSRVQASAALNGYWYKDTWRFTPGVSLSWSKEWQKAHPSFFPDQDIETGLLTPSVQIGDTLRLSDNATVEPWLGAAFDWTFVSKIEQENSPDTNDPTADLRLQGGLNFAFGSNAQLALTGEVGGLLLDSLNTYSGEANLAIQF